RLAHAGRREKGRPNRRPIRIAAPTATQTRILDSLFDICWGAAIVTLLELLRIEALTGGPLAIALLYSSSRLFENRRCRPLLFSSLAFLVTDQYRRPAAALNSWLATVARIADSDISRSIYRPSQYDTHMCTK